MKSRHVFAQGLLAALTASLTYGQVASPTSTVICRDRYRSA